jgi:hypothetical protein
MNDPILTGALRELRDAHIDHSDAIAEYGRAAARMQGTTDRLTKALSDVRALVASSDDPELTGAVS